MRAGNGPPRLGHRRDKTEGALDKGDVVVDGLGHADDGDGQAAPGDLGGDGRRAVQRAVATDGEQDADTAGHQRIDHAADVLIAARRAQHCAAELADVVYPRRGQGQRFVAVGGNQPFVAVAKAVDRLDAVVIVEAQDDGPDDVVDAGAQAATGDDARPQPSGVEEEALARAGAFEGGQLAPLGQQAADDGRVGVVEDTVVVGRQAGDAHGRRPRRRAQLVDAEAEAQVIQKRQVFVLGHTNSLSGRVEPQITQISQIRRIYA